jgi:predicted permease
VTVGAARLDALELTHLARGRGLPDEAARAIGVLLAGAELDGPRRDEVFEELVAHFEDGLAAGRRVEELISEFGDEGAAARLLVEAVRTPPAPDVTLPSRRRGDGSMARVVHDLRYAFRRLMASPGFAFTAILSLALGIGATTAVFSVVNAVILRKTPIRAPEEVVDVYENSEEFPYNTFSHPDYLDLVRGAQGVFSRIAATRFTLVQVTRDGGVSPATGEVVTGSYFPLLGITPEAGRLLGVQDDVSPGAHPVVVLGYGYWKRMYAADRSVVGRSIELNGRSYSIVGVAPESYPGAMRGMVPDFYAPMMMVNQLDLSDFDELQARGNHSEFVRARLKPGVTVARAQSALAGIAAELKAGHVGDWAGRAGFAMVPSQDVIVFPGIDGMLVSAAGLLLTAVGLVLLVVCANLASFLLARGMDRRKEIAVRQALGAARSRLVAQLLTETMLLGLLGGAGGVVVAVGLTRLLVTARLPLPIPIILDLHLDGRILLFATGLSLLAGLLFGLAPALRSSNPQLATTLRDESAGGGQRGRQALRNGLVIAQVAVSLVLLIGAGLFLRSLQAIRGIDPGFGRAPTGILQVTFPPEKYQGARQLLAQRELAMRLHALSGVNAVGMVDNIPLNQLSNNSTDFGAEGTTPPAGQTMWAADVATVDSGYFSAAGQRVLSGRDFAGSDGPDTPRVVIVNDALARRLWPSGSALGRKITRSGNRGYEVVGIVATTKIRSLGEDPRPVIFFPLAQRSSNSVWYLARTTGDAAPLPGQMLRAAQAMDRELVPITIRTMAEHLGVVQLPMRLAALVVSCLSILAVGLAAIGLYGTVSYAVAQRKREVGIRLALGAEMGDVVRLLMGSGLRLVLWGCAAGLVLSLLLAQLISRLLFGVGSLDPMTFIAVPTGLLVIAAVATWLPARRVTRVTPTDALRSEG